MNKINKAIHKTDKNGKLNVILLFIAVFLIPFIIYAHTINFKLTSIDDNDFIHTCAPAYASKTIFSDVFKKDVLLGRNITFYYRPLLSLSFVIDNKIAGESEKYAHFMNIILHCVSVLLIFFFLRKYLFDTKLSFLAAILFALHPLGIYTAAWIPGRNDSLFLIATLLSFIFFVEYLKHKKIYQLALHIFFLLAVFFAKESGIIAPFVFLLYFFTHRDMYKKNLNIVVYVLWAAAIILFIYMRKAAVPSGKLSMQMIAFQGDNIRMFFDYFASALFLKTPLAASVSIKTIVLGSIAMILTTVAAFYKKTNKTAILHACFYLAVPFIFIATNLFGNRLWFQGNRMYLPLLGIIIIFFLFFQTILKNKKNTKIVYAGIVCFILICSVITVKKSYAFKSSLSFLDNIIQGSAEVNQTIHKFRVHALIEHGYIKESLKEAAYIAEFNGYYDPEIVFALAYSLLLNENFPMAANVCELLISRNQLITPVLFLNAFLSYYFMGDNEKSQFYYGELLKMTGLTPANLDHQINRYLNQLSTIKSNEIKL